MRDAAWLYATYCSCLSRRLLSRTCHLLNAHRHTGGCICCTCRCRCYLPRHLRLALVYIYSACLYCLVRYLLYLSRCNGGMRAMYAAEHMPFVAYVRLLYICSAHIFL